MKSRNSFGPIAFAVAIILLHIQGYEGHSANSAATSYLIKPGTGVGDITIGASRDKVRGLAGEPISSLEGGDQFSGFTVHYEDDRAVEILIFSPRYRTAEGISIKGTPMRFLKTYPKSKATCYVDAGALSVTRGKVFDEIDKGIAFDQQIVEGRGREVINTISVHRANVPVEIYGEIEPCKK